MFDFFKEVIINSEYLPVEEGVDATGSRFKRFSALVTGEETGTGKTLAPKNPIFRVLRCADYTNASVADKVVYKTNGRVGTPAKVAFDLSELDTIYPDVKDKVGTYRLLLDISLINRYYSEYQHPWSEYHKPVMVEFEVKEKDDAASVAADLRERLGKYVPADYRYAVTVVDEDSVVISCTDPYQVVKAAKIQKLEGDGCIEGCSSVTYVDVLEGDITANVTPFATGEWLTENLRFPSYPNLRYASPNIDERPIDGALYVQYSFGYCSPRRGLTGQGTVGQMLASVTHHTFYVLASLAPAFESELKKGLPDAEIKTIGDELVVLNASDATPSVSYNAPVLFKKSALTGAGETIRVNLVGGDGSESDVAKDCVITVSPSSLFNIQGGATLHATKEVEDGARGVITVTYKNLVTTADFKVVDSE